MAKGLKELAEAAYTGDLIKEMVDAYLHEGGNIHAWIQCIITRVHDKNLQRDPTKLPGLKIGNKIILDAAVARTTTEEIKKHEDTLESNGIETFTHQAYFSLFAISVAKENNQIALMLFEHYYKNNLQFPHYFSLSEAQRALDTSVIFGNYEVFNQVVRHYEMQAIDIRSLRDDRDDNLFHIAAESGNVQIGKALLKYGFPVDGDPDLTKEGKYIDSPLCCAVMSGYTEFVEFLLTNGAKVNYSRGWSVTPPICYAISSGFLDIVKILHSHGGDISSNIWRWIISSFEVKETVDSSPSATREYVLNVLKEKEDVIVINHMQVGGAIMQGADLAFMRKIRDEFKAPITQYALRCVDVLLSAKFHDAFVDSSYNVHGLKHKVNMSYKQISEMRKFITSNLSADASSIFNQVVVYDSVNNTVSLWESAGKSLAPDVELLSQFDSTGDAVTTIASGAGTGAGAGASAEEGGDIAALAALDFSGEDGMSWFILHNPAAVELVGDGC